VLTVFADDVRHARSVVAAVATREPTIWAECWAALDLALPYTACVIAVVGGTAAASDRRLQQLRLRHPGGPLVVVDGRDEGRPLPLTDVAPDRVVPLGKVATALWPAVLRARSGDFLERVADAVDRPELGSPVVRRAIAVACRARPPLRSVRSLAEAVGYDRRTLWQRWRQALGTPNPPRLEDLLDWVLLLHAVSGKAPGRSWASIAGDLWIHPHTLGRIASRLAARPLRDLASGEQLLLMTRFSDFLAPLLPVQLAIEPLRPPVRRATPGLSAATVGW
jgi:hypothetical protein